MNKWLVVAGFMAVAFPSVALAKKELLDKTGVNLMEADKVYAAVNLHPDMERALLYTINYQLPTMIPRCSEVEITKLSKKKMKFRLVSTGREFEFVQHKRTKYMPLGKILGGFFTSSCSEADLAGLNAKDKEGIKVGRPLIGMTKEGVLKAMGPPPVHVNSDLTALEWTYWKNKFVRTVLTFNESGKLTNIR